MVDFLDFLPLYTRTEDDIRADMDADVNAGMATTDPGWVDTRPGSFFHMATQPSVIEAARVHDYIATIPAVAFIPFAFGTYLDYHADSLNTERIAAVGATGDVVFVGTAGTQITAGTALSTTQVDQNTPPVVFLTTDTVTIDGPLSAPGTLTGVVSAGGNFNGPLDRYYVFTAYDAAGETQVSNEVHINIPNGTVSQKITLSWPVVPDAVGYWLYEGSSAGGENQAQQMSSPGFVDPGGLITWVSRTKPTANRTGGSTSVPVQASPQNQGTVGNVAPGAINQMVTFNPGVSSVSNPLAFSNGADVESDPALQTRLLQLQQGTGPGTPTDYIEWVSGLSGVGQIFIIPNYNGPGGVGVVIMDANGGPVGSSLIASVQQALDPYPGQGGGIAPIDHIVTVMTIAPISVGVSGVVSFMPGYSYDGTNNTVAIRQNILNQLETFFSTLQPGQTVLLDQVKAQFFQVTGVKDVTLTAPVADTTISLATNPPQRGVLGTVVLT